jgi:hypothetical protein
MGGRSPPPRRPYDAIGPGGRSKKYPPLRAPAPGQFRFGRCRFRGGEGERIAQLGVARAERQTGLQFSLGGLRISRVGVFISP